MPSLAESAKGRGGSNNAVIGIVVLVLAVGLFFAPDIIKFFSSSGGSSTGDSAPSRFQTAATSAVKKTIERISDSALLVQEQGSNQAIPNTRGDSKAELMKSAVLSGQSLELRRSDETYEPGPVVQKEFQELDRRVSVELEKQKRQAAFAKEEEERNVFIQMRWAHIRKGNTAKILKKSAVEAISFAKDLPSTATNSKTALDAYIGIIRSALQGAEPKYPAGDLSYRLEEAQKTILAAFAADNLNQETVKAWSEIAVSKQQFMSSFPAGSFPVLEPFQPRMQLLALHFHHRFRTKGVWDPKLPSRLELEGEVLHFPGNNSRLEVIVNGRVLQQLRLRKDSKNPNIKTFRLRLQDGFMNSIMHFVLIDDFERKYEKVYNFFPRVNRFVWNAYTDGTYNIPFQKGDPRLDKFFLIREGEYGSPLMQNTNLELF